MPKDYPRTRRIAEQIQRDLSNIIRLDLSDPRVGMVTITDVDVSPDYSHAKVFFTLLDGAGTIEETRKALQHAAGFLRTRLAHGLKLRTTPELRFEYDSSVERGVRLSRLIDDAVATDSSRGKAK